MSKKKSEKTTPGAGDVVADAAIWGAAGAVTGGPIGAAAGALAGAASNARHNYAESVKAAAATYEARDAEREAALQQQVLEEKRRNPDRDVRDIRKDVKRRNSNR